jgi:hypothetical protein
MAALAVIGGVSIVVARSLPAQAPGTKDNQKEAAERNDPKAARPPASRMRASGTFFPKIALNLVIAGLGRDGCDVEIRPANPGCKFRDVAPQHVPSAGKATINLRDVELRGADRTFTMSITVREPGQAPKTIYRGFRLASRPAPPVAKNTIPSVTCYLSSRLAGVDVPRSVK